MIKRISKICPYHEEKTPSLVIDVEVWTYYCFGCGAKGDVVDLTKFENSKKEGVFHEA